VLWNAKKPRPFDDTGAVHDKAGGPALRTVAPAATRTPGIARQEEAMKDEPKEHGREPDHSLAHRIGEVAGSIVGAAAGAITGQGTAPGVLAGGAAGEDIASLLDEREEDAYWREQHRNEPYYVEGSPYETLYAPLYRLGWESRVKYHGRVFDDAAPDIRAEFEALPGQDKTWEEAQPAVRAAWDRVDERVRSFNGN
jgi:flavin-dependent dehydrogenase